MTLEEVLELASKYTEGKEYPADLAEYSMVSLRSDNGAPAPLPTSSMVGIPDIGMQMAIDQCNQLANLIG